MTIFFHSASFGKLTDLWVLPASFRDLLLKCARLPAFNNIDFAVRVWSLAQRSE
jgi:hypothetical protein